MKKTQTAIVSGEIENPLKVFVNSMMSDELMEVRKAIADAIREIPVMRPWLFEQPPPSSDTAVETYLEQLTKYDIYMLIIGHAISNPVKWEYNTIRTYANGSD